MKKFCLGFILLVIISCNKQIDYSKDINELKSQISLLQGQISGLRKTTDSLTNELKGINTQVSEVSRKVDSILNRITVINTQLIDLNGQLTKNSADISGLLKKIEDLQIELISLTKLIQDLKYQQIATSGYEIIPVDPRLKSNGKGVITIPVVIINYLPQTPDGIYMDPYRTLTSNVPWSDAHKYTIARAKEKILKDKIIEKNAIEEGTRYHDYATNTVRPYVNIDVVAYINVKSVNLVKVGTRVSDTTSPDGRLINPVTINWYNVDFNELLTRIKLQNYVEGLGVKEVWFTSWPRDNGANGYNVAESNMSPGTISDNTPGYENRIATDVSNGGGGTADLPRYKNTYVLYGCNGSRGADTDLHNRGHQLEAQLTKVNVDGLLWRDGFTPRDSAGVVIKRPRMGNCHFVPNATVAYDYGQTNTVKSDIMTWKPSGGTYVDVSSNTWLSKKYEFENNISMITPNTFATGNVDYTKDAQSKWFIFWWQSIPGYGSNVTDTLNGKKITFNNWWDIFYNWDDNMKKGTKLFD